MDQMEDVLIDCDVIDFDVSNDAQPSTSKATRSASRKAAAKDADFQLGPIAASAEVHRGPERQSANNTGQAEGAFTSAIMMYSPDIPSAEGRNAYDTKPNLANYYTLIETEETVKCVISTTLFCAIIIAIILVAFLENPMM